MQVKNKVIHGDALEIVNSLGEFDYLFTDPPYPIGGHGANIWDTKGMLQAKDMMKAMTNSLIMGVVRAVKKTSHFRCWIMCDWKLVSNMSDWLLANDLGGQSCIVWDKVNPSLGAPYHNRHELILTAGLKGSVIYNKPKEARINIVAEKRVLPKSKTHPFEKPVGLIKKCMNDFPPGRLLDPFCGTGGLLVGAQELGHDVVGIEFNEEFVDIANKRLEGGLV